MSAEDDPPRHWLDLFTEETWLEAARRGFAVTGFTDARWAAVRRSCPATGSSAT